MGLQINKSLCKASLNVLVDDKLVKNHKKYKSARLRPPNVMQ